MMALINLCIFFGSGILFVAAIKGNDSKASSDLGV